MGQSNAGLYTEAQRYESKLRNRLADNGLDDIRQLQYLDRADVSKWRCVGPGMLEYIEERLKSMGLTFGEYSTSFYLQHKEEIEAGKKFLKQPAEGLAYTVDWEAYRAEAAKAAMQGIIMNGDWLLTDEYKDGYKAHAVHPTPLSIARFAIACADALIAELTKTK